MFPVIFDHHTKAKAEEEAPAAMLAAKAAEAQSISQRFRIWLLAIWERVRKSISK